MGTSEVTNSIGRMVTERDQLRATVTELLQTMQNALVSLAIINMPIQEGSLDVATNADLMSIMADSFRAAIAKATR